MQNINLLEQQIDRLNRRQKKDLKLVKKSGTFFGAIFIIFALFFAVNFYLNFRFNQLKARVEQASQQIEDSSELEEDYLFFVDKLRIIKELFDKRASKQVALSYFKHLFGPQIYVSGFTYNLEEDLLSLSVASPHVFYLEEVLEILEDPEITQHFSTIDKTSLSRRLDGEYEFNLAITFEEDSELITEEKEY